MKSDSLQYQSDDSEVGVYECELHLKFRLIYDKEAMADQDELLDLLLDAFMSGEDDYLEPTKVLVKAERISELMASPEMRRRLIRLRNSKD